MSNKIFLPSQPRLLNIAERIHSTTGEVHPGWIRATSILLKGMERLHACDLASSESSSSAAHSTAIQQFGIDIEATHV